MLKTLQFNCITNQDGLISRDDRQMLKNTYTVGLSPALVKLKDLLISDAYQGIAHVILKPPFGVHSHVHVLCSAVSEDLGCCAHTHQN